MIRHDSFSRFYREPQGACVRGDTVTLRLMCDEDVQLALLRVWETGAERLIRMEREGNVFTASFDIREEAGLVWYFFILCGKDGVTCYGNARDGLGGEGERTSFEPPSYQITVYDRNFQTPAWMRDATMLQIMPDRYARGRDISQKQPPHGGKWHADWYEAPYLDIRDGDNAADDYYGGDFKGITQKLDHIKSMGYDAIYLNPVFDASSNHKYNTRDYRKIDAQFGNAASFRSLCEKAEKRGIRVILDGVFSHTGSDSPYFESAKKDKDSPYRSWYKFRGNTDEYASWWGFPTLPEVDKDDPSYRDFIIHDEDSVCAHWLREGASGWRLDVADELPMSFLRELRSRVKAEKEDGCVLGEVWEDASNKVAYGQLRTYCTGDTLDSVMNYPLREAVFDFLLGKCDAHHLRKVLLHMAQCYPEPFLVSCMNLLGSHDKARAISVLSGAGDMEPLREHRRDMSLTQEQYETGKARFLAAWRFVNALPGMPCMYYGDDAGLTGMADPFCRAAYPWGREDSDLLEQVRSINLARKKDKRLRSADMTVEALSADTLCVTKCGELRCILRQNGTCEIC